MLTIGLSACAGAQNQRHDRLNSAWRASAKPQDGSGGAGSGKGRSLETGQVLDRVTFVQAVLKRNPRVEAS
ncbi:MAG TPA: hypothetical protein PKA88_35925, partial [Polyangiaceae bacterium]|nr:hypothetical protein [Polyangiaceae bacterium]